MLHEELPRSGFPMGNHGNAKAVLTDARLKESAPKISATPLRIHGLHSVSRENEPGMNIARNCMKLVRVAGWN